MLCCILKATPRWSKVKEGAYHFSLQHAIAAGKMAFTSEIL
jgi:hypothetical protein